jgi:hypothetical protein
MLLGVLGVIASCLLLLVALLFRVTGLNPQLTGANLEETVLNLPQAEQTERWVICVPGLSLSGWQLHALNAGLFVSAVALLVLAFLALRGKGSAD